MLSFGEDLPEGIRFTIFTAANALLLCGILWYLAAVRPGDWRRMTGLALMAGGGAGNLLDRLGNDGKVVDFILLELGPLHTGIFNLADVVILMGFALLTASFFGREKVRSGSDEGPRLTESAG
jgi:signal peptidase II